METTKNYEKFKFLNYNREINQNHVEKIIESIINNGYISALPVLVDKDFNIIDGQHRFEACKQLGEPICYDFVNRNTEKSVIELNNTQKNWTLSDYVNYYAEAKNDENYIRIRKLKNKTKIEYMSLLILAGKVKESGGWYSDTLKQGKLDFTEMHKNIALKNFEFIETIVKNLRLPITRKLISGLMMLDCIPNYSRRRMIYCSENYSTKAYKCQGSIEYANMFVVLYNYNLKSKKERIELNID